MPNLCLYLGRSLLGSLGTSILSKTMFPEVGISSLIRSLISVVLPAPEGPTKKENSPLLIPNVTSLRATMLSVYRFVTLSNSSMAVSIFIYFIIYTTSF